MNQKVHDYVNLLSQLSFQVVSREDDQILREKPRQAMPLLQLFYYSVLFVRKDIINEAQS
jgi:hypothetical protein